MRCAVLCCEMREDGGRRASCECGSGGADGWRSDQRNRRTVSHQLHCYLCPSSLQLRRYVQCCRVCVQASCARWHRTQRPMQRPTIVVLRPCPPTASPWPLDQRRSRPGSTAHSHSHSPPPSSCTRIATEWRRTNERTEREGNPSLLPRASDRGSRLALFSTADAGLLVRSSGHSAGGRLCSAVQRLGACRIEWISALAVRCAGSTVGVPHESRL